MLDGETLTRLLRDVLDIPELELVLDSGYGGRATIPAATVDSLDVEGGRLTIRCGAARLGFDLATTSGAALVVHQSAAGGQTHTFHVINRSGDDVLRFAFPPAGENGAAPLSGDTDRERFWTALAERYAGTPGLQAITVSHRGPAEPSGPPESDTRVGEDVLLRCFAELRASGRVVFLLPGPAASAEVFPNVPLLDPHLSGDGWLYAGEPHRRDVHFHVQVARTARLRFQEEQRSGAGMGPAVSYTVRFLDHSGRTQLYGSVASAYTGPDGEVVRPSDAARQAFFRDLTQRYEAETGVEVATVEPLVSAVTAAGATIPG